MNLHTQQAQVGTSYLRGNIWDILYWLFVGVYVFCIVYKSSMPLMNADDINFYTALVQGKDAWHGLAIDAGRFSPLAGWNLNLIALFSTSPYAFMIGNALVFVVTAFCFYKLSIHTKVHRALVFVFFVTFSLTVGYVKITTEIIYPELTQIMFLCLFFLGAYYVYMKLSNDTTEINIYIYIFLLVFVGNCVIYLKEVSFILISGFGFFHLFFSFLSNDKSFKTLNAKLISFDIALMISGIVFLLTYMYVTANAHSSYANMYLFNPTRTFVIFVLAAPFVSVVLPCMLVARFVLLYKHRQFPNPFWDSIGLVAFVYFVAFLILDMGHFNYLMPANILAYIYTLYVVSLYGKLLIKKVVFWCVSIVAGFILITNAIPQGIHYFTLNKIQVRNFEHMFGFLQAYLADHPQTTLYFDGFGRGFDRYYYFTSYETIFSILPNLYNTQIFDIKSKEPNGKTFRANPEAKFSFYNSDEVSEPQSGDLVILTFFSGKPITPEYIQALHQKYELLFVTNNLGYMPSYNLMSLGAYVLQKLGINHSLSNVGNTFKLPSQMYVFRVP